MSCLLWILEIEICKQGIISLAVFIACIRETILQIINSIAKLYLIHSPIERQMLFALLKQAVSLGFSISPTLWFKAHGQIAMKCIMDIQVPLSVNKAFVTSWPLMPQSGQNVPTFLSIMRYLCKVMNGFQWNLLWMRILFIRPPGKMFCFQPP